MTSIDFAAAQQRVAARHAAREASLRQHETAAHSPTAGTLSSRLLSRLSTTITPLLSQTGTRPSHRVSQVDAELLDSELLVLLKSQVTDALRYYGPHIQDDWSDEISLALRGVLWKLSLWDHDASYGAALQGLRYVDARGKGDSGMMALRPPTSWQKGLYGSAEVLGRYIWTKWEAHQLSLDSQDHNSPRHSLLRKLSRISDMLSTTYSLAAFASFLVFLVNGRYRTLLDRILRLRLAPSTSQVSREVSFEYLNRQLVWHAFTEFLLFLLPLIGVSRWRRWISRAWRRARNTMRGVAADDDNATPKGEMAFLPERTCAICYQDQNPSSAADQEVAAVSGASGGVVGSATTDITNPYECAPCACVYCFVCLAQRLDAEDGEGWTCLRCGKIVQECRPWRGDVLEDEEDDTRREVSEGEKRFRTVEPIPVPDSRKAELETQVEEEVEQDADESEVCEMEDDDDDDDSY
ncbi:MAG: peroxisome assembly protein (Peroxin-2) [Chrysothrix sp. TS-e1954]|nr:MAG: peroxisome assembly protein (Peroxin-2) [Chrysothrix sp. TS-e1954]